MMLKLNNYDRGYHIASFAKTDRTLNNMKSRDYSIVYLKDDSLVFYPKQWEIKLEEDEIDAFNHVGEYSILEFGKDGVYIYYDSTSVDNALFITNKCNSNCVMCPTSDIVRKNSGIESVDNLLKISSQIPSDAAHITITGGEPFLLEKDIFKLFSYLKSNLNQVEYLLLTNGRALADKEYFNLFKENVPDNTIVGIPIHGYDDITHDGITRAKNSLQQTVKGIKNLLSVHIRVEIRIVVSKLNAEFLDKIVDLIVTELKGVYTIKFIGLEMLGNARRNIDQVWMSYSDSFKYMKLPIKKLVLAGFNVGIYNYPLCCVDKGYWPICEKSITDYKVRYLSECGACSKKDACGGMFNGTYRLMEGIVKAIK